MLPILFHTGFRNYEALLSFYHYIEPKLENMQYWMGEKATKEDQLYQTDPLRKKPGQQRKLSHLDELFIVLRLKAGLFVKDWCTNLPLVLDLSRKKCHLDQFVVV